MTNTTPDSSPKDAGNLTPPQVEDKQTDPAIKTPLAEESNHSSKTTVDDVVPYKDAELDVYNSGYKAGCSAAKQDQTDSAKRTQEQFDTIVRDCADGYLDEPEAMQKRIAFGKVRRIYREGYRDGYKSEVDFEKEGFFLSSELSTVYTQAHHDKKEDCKDGGEALEGEDLFFRALESAFNNTKKPEYETLKNYSQNYITAYQGYTVPPFC